MAKLAVDFHIWMCCMDSSTADGGKQVFLPFLIRQISKTGQMFLTVTGMGHAGPAQMLVSTMKVLSVSWDGCCLKYTLKSCTVL